MQVSREVLDLIREQTDILDVARELGLKLSKSTKNRYSCLCPSPEHKDSNPSFSIFVESKDYYCFGCFDGDVKVKTSTGYEAIKDVSVGDHVLGLDARYHRVDDVLRQRHKGDMLDIRLRNSYEVTRITPDHKVFAIKTHCCKYNAHKTCHSRCLKTHTDNFYKDYHVEEIRAGDLERNDILLYPVNSEVRRVSTFNFRNFDHLCRGYTKGLRMSRIKSPKINKDLLAFMGLFIAEGSTSKRVVKLTFNLKSEVPLAERMADIARKIFPGKVTVSCCEEKNAVEVWISNAILHDVFAAAFGSGALNKHIPQQLVGIDPKKELEILNYIGVGDGHTTDAGRKSITTISYVLVMQLRDILHRNNIIPSITSHAQVTDGRGTHHRQRFVISWGPGSSRNLDFSVYRGSKFVCAPITSIVVNSVDQEVFDLSVSSSHSYTVNNFAVHNCGNHGDVYSLVQMVKRVSFGAAITWLAKRAGIELDEINEEDLPFTWDDKKDVPNFASEDDMALFDMIDLRDTLQNIASHCGANSDEFTSSLENSEELLKRFDKATSPAVKALVAAKIRKLSLSLRENYVESECYIGSPSRG